MLFIRHGLVVVGLLLVVGCGAKAVPEPGIDAKAIMPEYVIDAQKLLGTSLKESTAKVTATTDFREYMINFISYVSIDYEYGRITPYFSESHSNRIDWYILNDKAYLVLGEGSEVGRVELTHSGIVSAVEAVMMLGYDPTQLIEHPVKHRNAERSDWFAVIDPYFHLIEIQWFDAKKPDSPGELGKVTQIRVSVW